MLAADDWRVLEVEKMIAIGELHLRQLRSYGTGDSLLCVFSIFSLYMHTVPLSFIQFKSRF